MEEPDIEMKKLDSESEINVQHAIDPSALSTAELRQAWLVAATETERDKKLVRDFFHHFIFIAIYFAIIFMQRDVNESHMLNSSILATLVNQPIDYSVQQFPKNFMGVQQWEDVRDYYRGVLVPALTKTVSYSGRNLTGQQLNNLQYSNQVLGAVRFRQMRVTNSSCTVASQYRSIQKTCFNPRYNNEIRETRPFGPPENTTKYQWKSNNGGTFIISYMNSDTYDNSGYVVDIPPEQLADKVEELIADEWWDEHTRMLVVSFSVLNVNLANRISTVYLLTEFNAAGAVIPNYWMRTYRINLYVTSIDYFRAFLEVIFILWVAYYIYNFIREIYVDVKLFGTPKKYFFDFWNIVELINLLLFISTIGFYIAFIGDKTKDKVSLDQKEYIPDLENIAKIAITAYEITAFNILLTTFKTFKYLKVNKRLYVLWQTLFSASTDLITYMIVFGIILLGFLLMGWITFGPDLDYFNGFMSSLGTCWQFLIGAPPSYFDLYEVNRALGPLFFTFFTVFVFFVLANVFIAIISDSYVNVHEQVIKGSNNVSLASLQKPVAAVFTDFKHLLATRKRMMSESELISKIKTMPETNLSSDEIQQLLISNGIYPYKEYISRIKLLIKRREKIAKDMIAEKKRQEHDEAEYEDWFWDGVYTPNANPKVIELNQKAEKTEVVNTMRNSRSMEFNTYKHKNKEMNWAILDKLEIISKRLDRLEEALNNNNNNNK